ncbi:MAG TPA: hypothetical protein VMF08_22240 [Candidatus Sulfotelmatobacter sp.]|nr:hypothetical protein [Candidatus Sulfotelmatobacter sp.]
METVRCEGKGTPHRPTQIYLAASRGLPKRVPALSLDQVKGSLT